MSDNLIAAEEAAGASAAIEEEAPDHTPEPETELEDAVDETPPSEEVEESVPEPAEVVDLEDIDPIPSDDEIEKLRIKPEDRQRLKEVAKQAREASKALEDFGGEFAVETLKPLAGLISKPEASQEELNSVFEAIAQANQPLFTQLAAVMAFEGLNMDGEFTDHVLTKVFGEGATRKTIKELLALDRKGVIDKDPEYLGFDPSELADLQKENAELKKQVEDAKRPEVNTKAVKDFEDDFYSEVPQALTSVFDKVHWPKDGHLARLVTETVQNRLLKDRKYSDTETFLKQTGNYRNGENRVALVNANLHLLQKQATAIAMELVRGVQEDRKKLSESARNRTIEKKKAEPKEITPQPLPKPTEFKSAEERQRALREQYRSAFTG